MIATDASALIKELRRRSGMSRAELARAAGVSYMSVCKWENGEVSPRLDTFLAILKACNYELYIGEIGTYSLMKEAQDGPKK